MLSRKHENSTAPPNTERPPAHGGDVHGIARELGVAPGDLLDFSANINPLGFPPGVRDAALNALDLLQHYPDPNCTALREELADYLGVGTSNLLIGNGSTELMYLVARALKPRRALVVAPAFSEYERALRLADVPVEYFATPEEDEYTLRRPLTPEEILKAGDEDCDVVFLANPSSPSGALLQPDELEPVVDAFLRAGLWVVLDEAFIDFDENASLKTRIGEWPKLVLLRSFTKFFGIPGIRLGYAVADQSVISRLEEYREPWSVNTIAQEMGRACLRDRDFIRRTRLSVQVERDHLISKLAKIRGLEVFHGRVNYLLLKLSRPEWNAARLRRAMMQQGILIRDASNFDGLNERFVRIAVRLRPENDRLLAALEYCYGS